MPLEIKVKKIREDAKMPSYAHPGDAGMDLYSIESYIIPPHEKKIVQTGISMEIPEGYFGSIRDRSGLAAKYGIHALGGVIDSGYRGEIGVILINLGKERFEIKKGDKIAQLLIQKIESPKILEVTDLSETSRGVGGFGSTGR